MPFLVTLIIWKYVVLLVLQEEQLPFEENAFYSIIL